MGGAGASPALSGVSAGAWDVGRPRTGAGGSACKLDARRGGFIGLNTVDSRIERYSLATRRSEPIADVRGLRLVVRGAVTWMGLAPDDSPLVTRDHSTGELYALDWEAP